MRRSIAAIAAVLLCVPAAHAGTYTLDFSPLAGDAGRTVSTTFDESGFRIRVINARVIGPGDPLYAGSIGLIPAVNAPGVILTSAAGSSFGMVSFGGTFAAGSGDAVNWAGRADWFALAVYRTFFAGTAPGTFTYTPGGGASPPISYVTQEIDLVPVEADVQLTGLTIVGSVASAVAVPEPAGPCSALLGLGWAAWIIRRRVRRSSGSCRA